MTNVFEPENETLPYVWSRACKKCVNLLTLSVRCKQMESG